MDKKHGMIVRHPVGRSAVLIETNPHVRGGLVCRRHGWRPGWQGWPIGMARMAIGMAGMARMAI